MKCIVTVIVLNYFAVYLITNLNVFKYFIVHVRQSGPLSNGIKAIFPVHMSSEVVSEI